VYVRGDPTIRPVCGLLNTRAALITTHSTKRCFRITILSSGCGWYTVMARPPAHRSFFTAGRPLTNDRNSLHVAWSSSAADRPRILQSSREAFGQSEPSTALAFFSASARAIFTSAGTRSATALARISHRTNARLGGQFDRHVSGVAGMLAGGAGRRGEC
jgi:hypothetical protein